MITCTVRILGRKRPVIEARSCALEFPGSERPPTLKDLIVCLVREEVRAFSERQESRRFVRALTEKEMEEGAWSGKIHPGGSEEEPGAANEEEALNTSLQAFEDGLYMVFIDQVQITSLDQDIIVTPDSDISLIRLVALAGG